MTTTVHVVHEVDVKTKFLFTFKMNLEPNSMTRDILENVWKFGKACTVKVLKGLFKKIITNCAFKIEEKSMHSLY